ncbi:ECF-type sigma factor [Steroidobacter cummioxidans]|uniref:ECF-type sigma factor n=1 Tax=Steroidobacter cummioxidans TaxID=1803913 RepID=UPI0019D4A9F5|nr:ECF-type sigma factor [Steroidobacter cummioxidans]
MRRKPRDRGTPPPIDWQERAQFFTLAVAAMSRFRAARAEDRRAKRPGMLSTSEIFEDREALNELLSRLEVLDPRQAQIVEMRCFGLTIEQTAEALGLSDDTVKREWTHARAWLRFELSQRSS